MIGFLWQHGHLLLQFGVIIVRNVELSRTYYVWTTQPISSNPTLSNIVYFWVHVISVPLTQNVATNAWQLVYNDVSHAGWLAVCISGSDATSEIWSTFWAVPSQHCSIGPLLACTVTTVSGSNGIEPSSQMPPKIRYMLNSIGPALGQYRR